MLNYLYINEKESEHNILLKNFFSFINEKKILNEIIIFVYDFYEIYFYVKLKDFLLDNLLRFFEKKYNFIINKEILKDLKNKKFVINKEHFEIFIEIINENEIILYGHSLKNDILDLFFFLNKNIIIFTNKEELYDFKIRKISIKDKKRNYFKINEIKEYYEFINLDIGLFFYLIKEHLEEIFFIKRINNLSKISRENIKINNSIKEFMKKGNKLKKDKVIFNQNKSVHFLNLKNVLYIKNDYKLYKSKSKKYILFRENFYIIKKIYLLNNINILKIKLEEIKNNEIIGLLNYKENKYLLRLTPSISKKLNKLKKLEIIEDFEEIIDDKEIYNEK